MASDNPSTFNIQIVTNDRSFPFIRGLPGVSSVLWAKSSQRNRASSINFSYDAIVLDDLLVPSNGEDFTSYEVKDLRSKFRSLERKALPYLKSGGVIVVLLSNTSSDDQDREFTHAWLENLHTVNIATSSQSSVVSDSDIGAVNQYLEYVDVCTYCIDINNSELSYDPIAVARGSENIVGTVIGEYKDSAGFKRSFSGSIVLLPRPESVSPVGKSISRYLMRIAKEYSPRGLSDSQSDLFNFSEMSETSTDDMGLVLDEQLADRCLPKFEREEYKDAVETAGRILDARVSEHVPDSLDKLVGGDLMKQAFSNNGGPLKFSDHPGEQEGVMFLYAGAIQGIRNVFGHDPDGGDYLGDLTRKQAREILFFIDLLLDLLSEYADKE